MAGRPRKSIDQHLRDGTYRADRHGPIATDQLESQAPPPPAMPGEVVGLAAEFWRRIVGLLGNLIRDRDAPLLAELCWHWAELQRIKTEIALVTPGTGNYRDLLIANGICTDKFDRIARRFGMTPVDRAKLKVESVGPAKPKVATRPPTANDRRGPPAKRPTKRSRRK